MLLAEHDEAQIILPELPRLPEGMALESPTSPTPPPPIEKDSIHSTSPCRRPLPPPKEKRSRGSNLQVQLAASSKQNLSVAINGRRQPRRHQHPFMSQLASIKQWFLESAKRAKSPGHKNDASSFKQPAEKPPAEPRRSPTSVDSQNPPLTQSKRTSPPNILPRPLVTTPQQQRLSLSPAPQTPRSSYRRSSAGLRGRKSTSSSISSIRSIQHVHTHSKASSTSSTNSVQSSALPSSTGGGRSSRSPHTSVKVLPATPTTSAFPSNIRIVRSSPFNESAFPSPSTTTSPGGLVYAKRKKTPFRGPMLNLNANALSGGAASSGGVGTSGRRRDSSVGTNRSVSVKGRRSGEIIEEEDEDEVEEVDGFSPLAMEADETIWEGEEGSKGKGRVPNDRSES